MKQHRDEGIENIIAIAIVAALALGIGWWVYAQSTTVPVVDTQRVEIPLGISPSEGSAEAPVTVVVFSDFECPYCGDFARNSYPEIKEKLIDTNKIRFVFKHFPLPTHQFAHSAAVAAACADEQGKFWEYHDVLFANQEKLALSDLNDYAAKLGLDAGQFAACMNTSSVVVDRDQKLGIESGVTGTPTFFFNGKKVSGALSVASFENEVNAQMQ